MAVRKIGPSWWVDFVYRQKRYRRRSPENTKAGALAYEQVMRRRLSNDEPVDGKPPAPQPDVPTFAEFAARWFSTYVVANNRLSEQRTKAHILRLHLLPRFGKVRIADIGAELVESYKVSKQTEKLTNKTINNHLAVLKACLRAAEEWQVIARAPRIKLFRTLSIRTDFLTSEELQRILSENTEPFFREMALLAADTGMRRGELLGLEWPDVDFDHGLITVRQSAVRGQIDAPKSGRTRHVPMSDELVTAFYSRRRTHGFVFGLPSGGLLHWKVAERGLHRLCHRAGVRRIGFHTLRHTFATNLAEQGVPLHAVQQLLGHASITTTMRYAHVAPSLLHRAIATMQDARKRKTAALVAAGRQCAMQSSPSSWHRTSRVLGQPSGNCTV